VIYGGTVASGTFLAACVGAKDFMLSLALLRVTRAPDRHPDPTQPRSSRPSGFGDTTTPKYRNVIIEDKTAHGERMAKILAPGETYTLAGRCGGGREEPRSALS
jgi:hypothetical protein